MNREVETDGRTPFLLQIVKRGREIIGDFMYGGQTYPYKDPALPWPVRYALKHHEARLGVKEIQALIDAGFADLATYCVLKATSGRKDLQQPYLEDFVNKAKTDPADYAALAKLHSETVQQLGPDFESITGSKLAQISRQGISLWDLRFKEVAQVIGSKSKDTAGVYISYSAALGLRQAVSILRENRLMLLIPEWINKIDNPDCGYEISLGLPYGERVNVLPKNFERPKDFVIVDDTVRTGNHSQLIWDFWFQSTGGKIQPDHISIINHVPRSQHV